MRYRVVKEFRTPRRRFRKDDEITSADLDGPLGINDWCRLGYLVFAEPSQSPITPVPVAPAAPTQPQIVTPVATNATEHASSPA